LAESVALQSEQVEVVRELLPDDNALNHILNMTWRYWRLWVPDMPNNGTQQTQVEGAKAMFLKSMSSAQPAAIAKGLFWLSLCMQQLPFEFTYLPVDLRRPREVLIGMLVGTAGKLLQSVHHAHYEAAMIEAYMLWIKILINMGHPLEAWQKTRDAGQVALVLGIHRPGKRSDLSQEHKLWTQIWQSDRQLSLVLGLPCFITSTHPSIAKDLSSYSRHERFCHRIAQIAGSICDRNDDSDEEARTKTFEIEAELDSLYDQLPEFPESPAVTLVEVYLRQTSVMLYEIEYIMLFLPYLFAAEDSLTQHARRRSSIASRGLLKSYLRLHEHEELLVCELMDFQAFLAGLLLIIGQLYHFDGANEHISTDQGLITDLIGSLRSLSQKMHCNVAGQGTHVLERLYAVASGECMDEIFQATIPYFGRVSINISSTHNVPCASTEGANSLGASDSRSQSEFSFEDMIDLELFDFATMDGFITHNSSELCGDWFGATASALDADYRI
jgi:hypothetical protein